MHFQGARCCGDVAFVFLQYFLDVFPLQSLHRHGIVRNLQFRAAFRAAKGLDDVIRGGWLGQIMYSAQLDGFDGGGNL